MEKAGEQHETLVVCCEDLVKIYKSDETEVVALRGLDLGVSRGELLAIIGNSGSGKSTLLNMLGGLDRPSAGKIEVGGRDLLRLSEDELEVFRRDEVGFVWQSTARNMVPYLSAVENVEMPMLLARRPGRARAADLLGRVGLTDRAWSRLDRLSGGEQQRLAIAVALANEPKLLLADEPTGSVDTRTAASLLALFRELNRTIGVTIIIVTHDRRIAREVDRVVEIRDGRTATEFLRRRSYRDELASLETSLEEDERTHEELAVVDKAGRLQLPERYVEALRLPGGTARHVKVELDGSRVVLVNPKREDEPPGGQQ